MGTAPGDEAATAQALTRDFNERYRDLGPRVLAFCLSTCQHGNIDGLKRAVGVASRGARRKIRINNLPEAEWRVRHAPAPGKLLQRGT